MRSKLNWTSPGVKLRLVNTRHGNRNSLWRRRSKFRTFSTAFDSLPASVREAVQAKVDEMGARLEIFRHKRLQGRPEFKLRVGDYRVLYEFDLRQGRIYLHYIGHRREIYKRR